MKGRPRKPTRVLELTGAFKKHPERRREREGEPEITSALGKAPDYLDEAQKARWEWWRKHCSWLTVVDGPLIEQTCRLQMLERNGLATVAQQKLLQNNYQLLGATPSTRSRVKVPPKVDKKTNPFAKLTA